ncbi:MAG TPA: hypothetical protein VF541_14195 [Longimicrobium sp.]|jgi:ABC-type glucose/galactose transport system permease subunit
MTLAMLAGGVFKDAPPVEIAIVVVIAALLVWVLWVGARSGKNAPPPPWRTEDPNGPGA